MSKWLDVHPDSFSYRGIKKPPYSIGKFDGFWNVELKALEI